MKQRFLARAPLIRRRVLLAVVFGIPVVFLRLLFDPINVPKLSLLLAGVSIAAAIRLAEVAQGAPRDGLKRIALPAAAVAAPLVLAWIASPYKAWSLLGDYPRFGGLVPYLAAILLGVLIADAFPGRVSELAWAFVAAGAVAGLYAVMQFVGLDPFEWSIKGGPSDQTSSTLGNPNFTGGFLAIVLPVAAGLFLHDRQRRRLAGAAALLVFAGLVVSASQGAWLAGLAGATVLAGSLLAASRPLLRQASFVAAALMAAVVVGTVVVTVVVDDSPAPETANRRGEWWQAAIAMGADSPFVGRGPNSFAVEHARFRTAEDAAEVTSDITDDPHSVPLSFFSGAGLLGLAGYLTAVGWALHRGAAAGPANILGTAFFGAVVAYAVQSLVSIDTVALRSAFWIVLGGAAAALAAVKKEKSSAKSRKAKKSMPRDEALTGLPVVAAAVLFAGLGVWGATLVLSADRSFVLAHRAFTQGDLTEALPLVESTTEKRGDYFYRQSFGRELGQVAAAFAEQGDEEAAKLLFDRSRDMFGFVQDFPDVGSVLDYARALRAWVEAGGGEAEAARDQAVQLYTRAVQIDPKNAVVVNEATEFARASSDWAALAAFLEPAAAQLGDANLWGTLALAHAHVGNEAESAAAVKRALRLDPEQGSALEAQVLLDLGN
jgi:O-antigen ligase